jgi:anti-sigma factor RsiW
MSMDEARNRDLMRLVAGAATPEEASALAARLAGEAGTEARLAVLRAAWDDLAEPPGRGVPPGFTGRVMARVRAEAGSGPSFAALPVWARAATAAVFVAGLALGAGLGMFSEAAPALPVAEAGEETAILWSDPGLAETYWLAVERGAAVLDGASADDADEAVR